MKPEIAHINSANSSLTPLVPFATAKIVRHPRSKKAKESEHLLPPDEETLLRLNAMARQYPFCVMHKGRNIPLL
ncbi:MAG TPA: hypothetical protein VE035_18620 [Puia sp.]|nr:hypothetical protein [Puia sp.]